MTPFVTDLSRQVILTNSHEVLTTSFGMVAILLLIVLLIYKEMVRVYDAPHAKRWIQTLNSAIYPLLGVFGIIVLLRLLDLLLAAVRNGT